MISPTTAQYVVMVAGIGRTGQLAFIHQCPATFVSYCTVDGATEPQVFYTKRLIGNYFYLGYQQEKQLLSWEARKHLSLSTPRTCTHLHPVVEGGPSERDWPLRLCLPTHLSSVSV